MFRMRTRQPIKGELNYEIRRLVLKSFKEAGNDAIKAVPILRRHLVSLPKRWNVCESSVTYDACLFPASGTWEPGPMAWYREGIKVLAYRTRPNGTHAEHKVILSFWSQEPASPMNPAVTSVVDDPFQNLSVHKTKQKIVSVKERS